VLAAPVTVDGRVIGTCNAISRTPRTWSAADVSAMRAFVAPARPPAPPDRDQPS
jgi:hypothetical protein